MTFKAIRVTILLILLAAVSVITYLQTSLTTSWNGPISVTLHPVVGDNSKAAHDYIKGIDESVFIPIGDFLAEEAKHYNPGLKQPIRIILGHPVNQLPPAPPKQRGSKLEFVKWNLRLRWWLYKSVSSFGLDSSTVRIFLIYHKPAHNRVLPHSYGLQKGLIGIVHAFAKNDWNGSNNVVITHELLHIFGATDKYDSHLRPVHPHGFAEPDKSPLYPQEYAEIMGGRIPVKPGESVIPKSLDYCLIGPRTASEINW